jgi:hypothetical protein
MAAITLGLISTATLTSCDENQAEMQSEYVTLLNVEDEGVSNFETDILEEVISDDTFTSDAEKEGMLFMLEEEKLARDVYFALNNTWGNQTFENIGSAESKHMEAVSTLIENLYGMTPELLPEGEFNYDELTSLYSSLVSKGNESLENALAVGPLIEEVDIEDLMNYLLETDNENVKIVYENLLKGSRNHLRAFVNQLNVLGVEYSPEVLSESVYTDIISSPMEKGKQYKKQKGNKVNKGGKGKSGNSGNGGKGDGTCNM